MIELSVILKILPIFLVVLVLPGPDFLVVTSISLKRGQTEGMLAALGIAIINSLYSALSLQGMAILFEKYFWLAFGFKICGGLYLLYLGFKLFRASAAVKTSACTPKISGRNGFVSGLLTTLSNPKAIAFHASIMSLVVSPSTTLGTKICIVGVIGLSCYLWFSFVAYGFSRPKVVRFYEKAQTMIDKFSGACLSFFGLALLRSASK